MIYFPIGKNICLQRRKSRIKSAFIDDEAEDTNDVDDDDDGATNDDDDLAGFGKELNKKDQVGFKQLSLTCLR